MFTTPYAKPKPNWLLADYWMAWRFDAHMPIFEQNGCNPENHSFKLPDAEYYVGLNAFEARQ